MRRLLLLIVVALALPSIGAAAKPPAPGKSQASHAKSQASQGKAPKVMYVLKGTLTAYTAAEGTTNGSVSILVKSANHYRAALKGQTLTFGISSSTKVVAPDGAPAADDNGIVKLRGPKKVAPTESLATVLQALPVFQVIDQGSTT